MEAIRINKYLSESGVLSRRKADKAIEEGRVMIDGEVAVLGSTVEPGSVVTLDGKVIGEREKTVIYAYNKPLGQVCTAYEADKKSIFRSVTFPMKVNYVGRLDKDSQGLLLLTNDGELSNAIQKARNHHEKEYVVRVDKPLTEEFLKGMREGVPILDTVTRPCTVRRHGQNSFKIIITQGLNRQIRRMCEYFGYRVVFLKRIRVMNVGLGDLAPGEYRELTPEEERVLRRDCYND